MDAVALGLLLLASLSNALDTLEDIEVILLPVWNSSVTAEVPLAFTVFGRTVELTLRRNDKLVAPGFQVWRRGADDARERAPELSDPAPCHYLHRDHSGSAAVSLCRHRAMHGLVFLENATLEITPLRHERSRLFGDHFIEGRSGELSREPHVVRRSDTTPASSLHPSWTSFREDEGLFSRPSRGRIEEGLTVELAVFFDQAGYKLFSPFLDGDEEKMRDMLLAYVNGVQALYHHPSLGAKIDVALVRLEMMRKQPSDLPHFDGERGKLLDSFCDYSKSHNPPDDAHPDHWDMGLYVSGLDFYAMEGGRRSSVTMGLATVGGVCLDQYSCVIAELGVTNSFGKPYPSAGFTSVYIAAHEIGHNLGMHHDSTGNSCPKDGYIMSPSRGTQGETVWSECSRDVARKLSRTKPCLLDRAAPGDAALNHARFLNLPGREWSAKRQCELLLRDKDAVVATLSQACQALQCKSPHRSGYYFAGPALDGTYCAQGKECRGGECLPSLQISPNAESVAPTKGGWGAWREEACRSGCIQGAKGARPRRRACDNPPPRNTVAGCEGANYDVLLCDDERLCKGRKRETIGEFGSAACGQFSERLPELDSRGSGLQAPHEPERPWMACAIFCRRKGGGSYYTPRIELNDLGLDPYFPDGTWCHAEGGQDYFCRQHHCLPENFRFGKELGGGEDRGNDEDLRIGPQNARPGGHKLSDQLVKYLSLGPDGLPLLTTLPPDVATTPDDEDDWSDKDYIELPLEMAATRDEEAQVSRPRVPKLLDLDRMFSEPP